MISMGVRPEEALQLRVGDVRRRDGILCLAIGENEDDALKTSQSRRILPIPQMLLDLGLQEWIVAKRRQGEVWLFPEIVPDKCHDRRSQIFGDRLRTLLKKLDLSCPHEDIYAMRRTLSSKLLNAHVDPGVRKRVLGHLDGSTLSNARKLVMP